MTAQLLSLFGAIADHGARYRNRHTSDEVFHNAFGRARRAGLSPEAAFDEAHEAMRRAIQAMPSDYEMLSAVDEVLPMVERALNGGGS